MAPVIVGSEEQANDLISYIKQGQQSKEGAWETNIFGKSVGELMEDGIRNKIEPPTCIDDLEGAQEFDILPRTLIEAVQAFEKDEFFHKVYGEELSRIIIQKKKQEWDEFCEQVTAWEVEKYLDRI